MQSQSTASSLDSPEEWRSVPGSPGFEASSWGRVRRIATGRLIKPRGNKRVGYYYVDLSVLGRKRDLLLHLVVLRSFAGERPADRQADHINGDRSHCYRSNLEWVTREENAQRKVARAAAGQTLAYPYLPPLDERHLPRSLVDPSFTHPPRVSPERQAAADARASRHAEWMERWRNTIALGQLRRWVGVGAGGRVGITPRQEEPRFSRMVLLPLAPDAELKKSEPAHQEHKRPRLPRRKGGKSAWLYPPLMYRALRDLEGTQASAE
mgnify:CR=1 FL=1